MCKSTDIPLRSTLTRQLIHNIGITSIDDEASIHSDDSATTNINIFNELPLLLPYAADDDGSLSSSSDDSDYRDVPPPFISRSYNDDDDEDVSSNTIGNDNDEVEQQQRPQQSSNISIEMHFVNEMRRILDHMRLDVRLQSVTNQYNHRSGSHLDSQTNHHRHLNNERIHRVRSQFIVEDFMHESTEEQTQQG